ncbi:MAG TPA: bifunctional pyr operon transcriptional regulator/uracil phosphoribosyltransferase PyrR [candidate division Zixibacteria bacterium]|nr:bifunctional pyr operon transcriptional regulator/uracil phosphoribosyltransferase PyrR [candidate division Zixibacteria bacterium]
MRSLVSIADLGNDEIEAIFELADDAPALVRERPAAGRIMATLFYEPSTRTRLSFESAMQRLGGSVVSCSDMRSSSAAKGESIADTARVVSSYADVLVVRHYWDGAAQAMAEHAEIPLINAGDGSHEHPTQTLCDLYTLRREKGGLKGLTVVVCGDLKHGRTIHSLVYALARFGANVVALAAAGMELPAFVLERLEREFGYAPAPLASDDLRSVVSETDALYLTPRQPHRLALLTDLDAEIQRRLTGMVSELRYDAFYMTRKQKERLGAENGGGSYPTIGSSFLDSERFRDTVVMHPLPRVDELSPELDRDRRGVYFKQAAYGVPVRMALLKFILGGEGRGAAPGPSVPVYETPERLGPSCPNPNCVTVREPASTRHRFGLVSGGPGGVLILRCFYCDHPFKVRLVGHAPSRKYCAYDIALAPLLKRWLGRRELVVFDSVKQAEELGYEPYRCGPERVVMDEGEIEAALLRLSEEILRDTAEPERLFILGIRSGGAWLARRIAVRMELERKRKLEVGEIEIYGESDEIRRVAPADAELGPVNLRDRDVVLVDDVIHTGRTANHALSVLFRSGRPKSVRLAVLVDRGRRQVPLKPNYVGKHLPTSDQERVRVRLREQEPQSADKVTLYAAEGPGEEVQEIA